MAGTNRKYYGPEYKTTVLDEVSASGKVAPVARKWGLEPGLVYAWKNNEKDIRKAAAKGAGKNGAGSDVALKNGISKKPLDASESAPASEESTAFNGDGPKLSIHALGPWLTAVVRAELPGVIGGELDALIEKKVSETIRRLLLAGTP
jgi:hypothetical protein